jgi:hypothetical protein
MVDGGDGGCRAGYVVVVGDGVTDEVVDGGPDGGTGWVTDSGAVSGRYVVGAGWGCCAVGNEMGWNKVGINELTSHS